MGVGINLRRCRMKLSSMIAAVAGVALGLTGALVFVAGPANAAETAPVTCGAIPVVHTTDWDDWEIVKGEVELTSNGVLLTTTGNETPAGESGSAYINRSFVGSLADIGDTVAILSDNDHTLGIHVETSNGWLTYENVYGGMWWSWSDFGVTSGGGYPTYATLADIVAANPEVTTSSFDILINAGTDVPPSSSTVTSVKIGCTEYTFGLPVPEQPADVVTIGEWVDGSKVCAVATVGQSRTVRTQGHVLVNGVWELDPENVTTETETRTRDLSAAEIAANKCALGDPQKPARVDTGALSGTVVA